MGKILFIINPGASGGQGQLTWDRFQDAWPEKIDPIDTVITDGPGHATRIAASLPGYDTIVSIGGDGTVNEILNGIMEREVDRPALSIIPAGTGNDIARSLGLFPFERAYEVFREGQEKSFDLVRVDAGDNGTALKKYFLLAGALGFSVSAGAIPWLKRVFGPGIAYYLNTMRAILAHRSPYMTAKWNGKSYEGLTWTVILANVESISGGSMRIAPGARPDDGMLWVTIIETAPKLRMMLKVLPKVAAGEHLNEKGFHYFSTEQIELTSETPVIIDADGETVGSGRNANIRLFPGAIRIVAPAEAKLPAAS